MGTLLLHTGATAAMELPLWLEAGLMNVNAILAFHSVF